MGMFYTLYEGTPWQVWCPPGTTHSYDITDSVPCAALYVLVTRLKVRSVLLSPFAFSLSSPNPLPPGDHRSVLSVSEFVSVSSFLFCFLDSTSKGSYLVYVFLYLPYFTEQNALWVHPCCCKWKRFVVFYDSVTFHCTSGPRLLHSSTCRSTDLGLCLRLGYRALSVLLCPVTLLVPQSLLCLTLRPRPFRLAVCRHLQGTSFLPSAFSLSVSSM